ncbi:hypothetical protein QBC46DRAFT_379588 [Diplogelasinospora grovesii]|uniref:Uncharacterized protein n=1 Tax=Diplogelasinospora grovesii TaxID=303347 RepID=A0AAN6NCF7_9PEZI|nr:hypothetical protein QBC46DRAFT_379588 [Diplogelasinospora grovesii]
MRPKLLVRRCSITPLVFSPICYAEQGLCHRLFGKVNIDQSRLSFVDSVVVLSYLPLNSGVMEFWTAQGSCGLAAKISSNGHNASHAKVAHSKRMSFANGGQPFLTVNNQETSTSLIRTDLRRLLLSDN